MSLQAPRDTEGYLINPGDWSEEIAIKLATEEGIELNDTYWPVLKFMRAYYDEQS